jgi:3-dehydroquinate synthase
MKMPPVWLNLRMFSLHLKEYDIFVGDHREPLSVFLKRGNYSKIAVLVDSNTKRHCLPLVLEGLDFEMLIIEIPAGEQHKTVETCQLVWGEMSQLGLDRHSLLICLGGGVTGDLGGFSAAAFLRGIDFIQIPTTLLSMSDSSIGGKVGVDFNFVKNIIGFFQNPKAVFINPVFLKTLPAGEIRSGFAEIFKHALIADAALWSELQSVHDLRQVDWKRLLPPSLAVKKRIVEEDPHEKGIRKALNFGHTVGHAVESFSLKTNRAKGRRINPTLLHGEAVALGIVCESWLSWKLAGLPELDLHEITAFVRRFYEPYPLRTDDFSQLLALMKKDKKNEQGRINFTLLPAIGAAKIDWYADEKLIGESLEYYISEFQ